MGEGRRSEAATAEEELTAPIDSERRGWDDDEKGFLSMFITCWRPFTEGRPRVARLFREAYAGEEI